MSQKIVVYGVLAVALLATLLLVGVPLLSKLSAADSSEGSYKETIKAQMRLKSAEVGKAAPAIELQDVVRDEPFTMTKVAGKPVLVYFFASWCSSCAAEAPHLAALKEKHGANFELVFVDLDVTESSEDVRDFKEKYYKRDDAHWLLEDEKNTTSFKYGVLGTSYAYAMDAQGTLLGWPGQEGPGKYSPLPEEVEAALGLA